MIKVEQFTSAGITYVDSKDFEVVNVTSERNVIHDCKSLTFWYGLEFSSKLGEFLKTKYKNAQYKVLVIGDETIDDLVISKVIVLLKNQEMIDFVIDSPTILSDINVNIDGDNVPVKMKSIEYDILDEEPKDLNMTKFYQQVQLWCQTIQSYLSNELKFNGITKITASACKGDLVSFNISNTGKGVNDDIVFVMKNISQNVFLSKYRLFWYNENDIYEFINSYFKS